MFICFSSFEGHHWKFYHWCHIGSAVALIYPRAFCSVLKFSWTFSDEWWWLSALKSFLRTLQIRAMGMSAAKEWIQSSMSKSICPGLRNVLSLRPVWGTRPPWSPLQECIAQTPHCAASSYCQSSHWANSAGAMGRGQTPQGPNCTHLAPGFCICIYVSTYIFVCVHIRKNKSISVFPDFAAFTFAPDASAPTTLSGVPVKSRWVATVGTYIYAAGEGCGP